MPAARLVDRACASLYWRPDALYRQNKNHRRARGHHLDRHRHDAARLPRAEGGRERCSRARPSPRAANPCGVRNGNQLKGIGLEVLKYLSTRNESYRRWAEQDISDFDGFHVQYRELIASDEERALEAKISELYLKFVGLARNLIAARR